MNKSPAKIADALEEFNKWRRGDDEMPQPHPREIGEALDAAVKMLRILSAAIKETLDENAHLADGKNCTLIKLKRAMKMVGDRWRMS